MINVFDPLKDAVFTAAKEVAEKYIKIGNSEIVFLQGTILMLQDGFPTFLEKEEIEVIYDALIELKQTKNAAPIISGNFTSEVLPSGVECIKVGEDYKLVVQDCHLESQSILLSKLDISRLYGIIYPTKVHGKWKGHCGEGPAEDTVKNEC